MKFRLSMLAALAAAGALGVTPAQAVTVSVEMSVVIDGAPGAWMVDASCSATASGVVVSTTSRCVVNDTWTTDPGDTHQVTAPGTTASSAWYGSASDSVEVCTYGFAEQTGGGQATNSHCESFPATAIRCTYSTLEGSYVCQY